MGFNAYTLEEVSTSGKENRKMKHKVTIRVVDEYGRDNTVLRGARARIPTRLLRFLFGGYTNVYLLTPGKTVETVNIEEVKEKEL